MQFIVCLLTYWIWSNNISLDNKTWQKYEFVSSAKLNNRERNFTDKQFHHFITTTTTRRVHATNSTSSCQIMRYFIIVELSTRFNIAYFVETLSSLESNNVSARKHAIKHKTPYHPRWSLQIVLSHSKTITDFLVLYYSQKHIGMLERYIKNAMRVSFCDLIKFFFLSTEHWPTCKWYLGSLSVVIFQIRMRKNFACFKCFRFIRFILIPPCVLMYEASKSL